MNKATSENIRAVVVNHNTSLYTELVLRSFFAMHDPDLDVSITVMDNASRDDTTDLEVYATGKEIPIAQSGFSVADESDTRGVHGENVHGVNSHGEVLSRFVLQNQKCKYYLFLDTDICFIEKHTIPTMVAELEADANAFGVGARQSHGEGRLVPLPNSNPDIYESRLHPCCALIKNTPLFRHIVEEVGLSDVKFLLAGGERIYPTCKLMTRVMKTHGLHHSISKASVIHMFAVTYNEKIRSTNDEWCRNLLLPLREREE